MELHHKIKQLRHQSGLTQEQLAGRLGITPQSVSKWEHAITMPDISLLPSLAEVFGVTIDDLFDLSIHQRFNRIENRMQLETELPQEVFWEYETYLKQELTQPQNQQRAIELLAHLYWHRMESYASKVRHYAKEAIKLAPNKKECQWLLQRADRHAIWDWNASHHHAAIDFYADLIQAQPTNRLSYCYLLDNLIADHRTDEAEVILQQMQTLPDHRPILAQVYQAHIALARFDEAGANQIIENLVQQHPHDFACLFEAAQYYAKKCDYAQAVHYYEQAFIHDPNSPRFSDALEGIATIYEIRKDYTQAVHTYDCIITLFKEEWGMTDEITLQQAYQEKSRLLHLAAQPIDGAAK